MTEERYLLDASAILAMLGREPGGDVVATVVSVASVSAVNWSEVVQKARAHGVDVAGLREDLESLGVRIIPFAAAEAEAAADIWRRGGQHLAMADRACLATALIHGLMAMTADRAWASLDVDTDVQTIR